MCANCGYTVESVEFAGMPGMRPSEKLSPSKQKTIGYFLQQDIVKTVKTISFFTSDRKNGEIDGFAK